MSAPENGNHPDITTNGDNGTMRDDSAARAGDDGARTPQQNRSSGRSGSGSRPTPAPIFGAWASAYTKC